MMWQRIFRKLLSHAAQLTWRGLLASLVVYIAASYVLMALAGEADLIESPTRFFYWLIITASTVGYGDFSPSTESGQWLSILWVVPLGIALFAATIGKISALIIDTWHAKINGELDVTHQNHTVILGFNHHTKKLIEQIQQERGEKHPITLVATANEVDQNPMPSAIEFVKIDDYTRQEFVERANIAQASNIIIDIDDDNATNVVCLFCGRAASPQANITATVASEDIAQLIEQLSPNINIIPDLGKEVLVKAAIDPGSEEVIRKLIDIRYGQTQFSSRYQGQNTLTAEHIALALRREFSATLIAYQPSNDKTPMLNPDNGVMIAPGDRLYYIATHRIEEGALASCLAS